MAENQQVRLTLQLHAQDRTGVVGTVTESEMFGTCDFEAQYAWIRDVQLKWCGAEIVNEHSPTRIASMQIMEDLRCEHANLAYECPVCNAP